MAAPDTTDNSPDTATGLSDFLALPGEKIHVRLARVEGSAPRETGAYMLVDRKGLFGTIGGGFAEFDAIAHARAMLEGAETAREKRILLGPDTGQCCGGRLTLAFSPVTDALAAGLVAAARQDQASNRMVLLFGAGHVGKALVRALSPLPFRLQVIETRAEELGGLPQAVERRLLAMPEQALDTLPAGAAVLILTHDHALDFLIAREALRREDLAYVGMIGSATKRATFASYWRKEGGDEARLGHLTMPIGGTAVKDKRPAVIAALVAAELLALPPLAGGQA